jgi:capsular exopolysaccharide synthesis family protein
MALIKKAGFELSPSLHGEGKGDADPTLYLPKVEPGRFTGIIRRRGWMPVLTTVCALAAMFAYLKKAPKYYESKGTVYVQEQAPRIIDFQQISPVETKDLEQLRSIEQSMPSSTVLMRVIKANHLAEQPDFAKGATNDLTLLRTLQHRVTVALERGTRLMGVTVEDTDPERAKRLVESVIAEYQGWTSEVQREQAVKATEGLRVEEQKLQEKMDASTALLEEFRKNNPLPGLDARDGEGPSRGELASLNDQLTHTKSDRLRLEAEVEAFKKFDPEDPEALAGLGQTTHGDDVAALARTLQAKEADFGKLKERYLYKHPVYKEADNEIAQLKKNLADRARFAGEALEKSYHVAQDNEAKLQRAVDAARGSAVAAEGSRAAFARLQKEAEGDQEMHATVSKRLRETAMATAYDGSVLDWRDHPMVADKASKPNKAALMLVAGAGGIFCGLLMMVGAEFRDGRIRDSAAAARATGVPLLASLPFFPRGGGSEMVLLSDPASKTAEAFRRARAMLNPPDGGGQRTVLFASAQAGEGRSVCAMNFAASLALQGQRTLLLDADMRSAGLSREHIRPDQGSLGLGDYLSGAADPAKACFPTALPNLYLLSSGALRGDAAELLSGTRFPALLEDAYRWFDAVVIDTPPILSSSDALVISRYADRTCFVVRQGAGDSRELKRAADLLRTAGGNLVGFIWNEMPLRSKTEPAPAPFVPVARPNLAGSGLTTASKRATEVHGAGKQSSSHDV